MLPVLCSGHHWSVNIDPFHIHILTSK
jgi:hypothetical protein